MKVYSDWEIQDFYKTLELPLNSSQAEVKEAFRSLARKYHPDRCSQDPANPKNSVERFIAINAAYEFLKTYKPRAGPTASPSPKRPVSNPSNSRPKVSVSRTSENKFPPGSLNEAWRLYNLGNLEEALMELDVAIGLQDNSYAAYQLRSEIRLAFGNVYGSERDLRLAKHYYWLQTGQEQLSPTPKPPKEKSSSPPQTTKTAKSTVEPKPPQPKPESRPASYAGSSSSSSGWSETVNAQGIELFYQVLELPLNSSQTLIKAAYQVLANRYHSDQATGDAQRKAFEQRLNNINIAYEFLKTYTPIAPQNKSARVSAVPQTTPINPFFQEPPTVKSTVETKPPQSKSEPLYKQAKNLPKDLQTFVGHVDIISQLLFVDRSLISASHDGSARIWDVETGELQGYFMVGTEVTAIAASPSLNLFITGDRRGQVKMWSLKEQKLIRSLPLHTNAVTGIHISSNGNGFTTTSEDGTVKAFKLQPASLLDSLQIANVPILSSGILDDRIFTTSADSKLNVIQNGKILKTSDLSSPSCKAMAINSQRKWIAIGDDRGSVHCFDANGNLVKSFAAFAQGAIQSMSFITKDDRLIVAGEKGGLKIWNIKNWDLVKAWNANEHPITAIVVPDGGKIAIADHQTIRLLRLP